MNRLLLVVLVCGLALGLALSVPRSVSYILAAVVIGAVVVCLIVPEIFKAGCRIWHHKQDEVQFVFDGPNANNPDDPDLMRHTEWPLAGAGPQQSFQPGTAAGSGAPIGTQSTNRGCHQAKPPMDRNRMETRSVPEASPASWAPDDKSLAYASGQALDELVFKPILLYQLGADLVCYRPLREEHRPRARQMMWGSVEFFSSLLKCLRNSNGPKLQEAAVLNNLGCALADKELFKEATDCFESAWSCLDEIGLGDDYRFERGFDYDHAGEDQLQERISANLQNARILQLAGDGVELLKDAAQACARSDHASQKAIIRRAYEIFLERLQGSGATWPVAACAHDLAWWTLEGGDEFSREQARQMMGEAAVAARECGPPNHWLRLIIARSAQALGLEV